MKRINPEKREEWDTMLDAPLPGRAKALTPHRIEDESGSFMAAMAAMGGA